jgi:hypothetical protein
MVTSAAYCALSRMALSRQLSKIVASGAHVDVRLVRRDPIASAVLEAISGPLLLSPMPTRFSTADVNLCSLGSAADDNAYDKDAVRTMCKLKPASPAHE